MEEATMPLIDLNTQNNIDSNEDKDLLFDYSTLKKKGVLIRFIKEYIRRKCGYDCSSIILFYGNIALEGVDLFRCDFYEAGFTQVGIVSEYLYFLNPTVKENDVSFPLMIFDCYGSSCNMHFMENATIQDIRSAHNLGISESNVIQLMSEMVMTNYKKRFGIDIANNITITNRLKECCKETLRLLENGNEKTNITFNHDNRKIKVYFNAERISFIQNAVIADEIGYYLNIYDYQLSCINSYMLIGEGYCYDVIEKLMKSGEARGELHRINTTRSVKEFLCTTMTSFPSGSIKASYMYDFRENGRELPDLTERTLALQCRAVNRIMRVSTPIDDNTLVAQVAMAGVVCETVTGGDTTQYAITRLVNNRWEGPTVMVCLDKSIDIASTVVSPVNNYFIRGVLPNKVDGHRLDISCADSNYVMLGCMEGGCRHGLCTAAYLDSGLQWTAECFDGERNGPGEVRLRGQTIWRGDYLAGSPEGYGWYEGPDGHGYCGGLCSGECHGVGVDTINGEEIFCGVYVDGVRDGCGSFTRPDRRFDGRVHEDLAVGAGVSTLPDGTVMDGVWNDDTLCGRGTIYQANGDVVEGFFSNGVLDGYGVIHFADGSAFEGMFKSGKRCGFGLSLAISGAIMSSGYYDGDVLLSPTEELPVVVNTSPDLSTVPSSQSLLSTEYDEEWSVLGGDAIENAWIRCVGGMLQNEDDLESEVLDMTSNTFSQSLTSLLPQSLIESSPYRDLVTLNNVKEEDDPDTGDGEENTFFVQKSVSFKKHGDWRMVFEGKNEDGTGKGQLITGDDEIVYEGLFVKYHFEGKGTIFYKNGKKQYEGVFKDNVLHGRGKWYFSNGCLRFDGMWVDGIIEGNGCLYKAVNLKYCNSQYRQYFIDKGIQNQYISFADGFDPYSFVSECMH